MKLRAIPGETAEDDTGERWRLRQRLDGRGDRDLRGTGRWKTIDPGGNRREGQRSQRIFPGEFDGAAIARGQQGLFTLGATMPDRTDGMNHMPRRQPITPGDFCLAGRAAVETAALGQQFGTGRAMDSAIHATAAEQRRIGRVDDGVNAQRGDVGNEDFQPDQA
jgi:hypothetical protein